MYVVEVSNPRLANDSAYERWTVETVFELATRIEDCAGLQFEDADDAAELVAAGESFEHVDEETGRTVTAKQKAPVVA